jgi:putative transposase
VGNRGNGLKAQPVAYCWTSRAGRVIPTSYEMMRIYAVKHKPMNLPKGTPVLKGADEVSSYTRRYNMELFKYKILY